MPPSERLGRATLARVDRNEPQSGRTRRSTLGQRLLRKLRGNEIRAVVKTPDSGSR